MKARVLISLFFCLGFLGSLSVFAAEKAPQSVVNLANSKLAALGSNSVIVNAVKAANSQNKSLSEIQSMDQKWRDTPGIAGFMKEFMENDCAKFLIGLMDQEEYYAEIFVMDNKGANVCQTNKTSDYWQGDEAKFKNSFNGGNGAVFVDEVEFDDSAQVYVAQVSVPVMAGGKAIGAITFGIDVDKVE